MIIQYRHAVQPPPRLVKLRSGVHYVKHAAKVKDEDDIEMKGADQIAVGTCASSTCTLRVETRVTKWEYNPTYV